VEAGFGSPKIVEAPRSSDRFPAHRRPALAIICGFLHKACHGASCIASCLTRLARSQKNRSGGQPEIGAHFVSFNFPNSLICVVVSSVGRHRFAVEQPLLCGRMPESETSSRAFCWARPRRLQQDDWRSGHAINPSDSVVAMLVALIACSLVAIVAHTKLELPTLRFLRRLLIKRSDPSKLPVPRPA
jgi:hypothetical protein